MGNSPSPSRRAVPVQRDEEISKDKIPPPSDTETEYYINDKVKIIPSVSLTTEPNPVTTLEQQSKMARSRLQKNHRLKLGNNFTSTDEELKEIDQHAARVPLSALNSFRELVDYFNEPLQGNTDQEQLLIRSFLVWLAHQQDTLENVDIDDSQQSVTSFRSTEVHGRTPDALVKLLKNNKTTYTTCFVLLCWAAGIRCVKIDGVYRTGKSTELKQCVWTAVLVNDAWQIVHPYRVCQGLSGKLQKEFYKPSEHSTMDTKDVTKGSFLNHYIFCNPHHFIYECYPNDSKWQLLPEPITIERFQTLEFLYHPWWEMRLKLTSKQTRELVAENGRITISFEGIDKSVKNLVLWYDLQLLQSDIASGEDNPSNDYLQRLVYLVRNRIVWNCDIIFPVTGKYKIIFYGGQFNRPLLRICEFDITCDFCHPDPIPLPRNPNVIGLGPGPVMTSVGISYPSHENGFIHSSIDKTLKLKFRVDNTITRNCITKAKLITSELTAKQEEGDNITFNSVCTVQEKRTYKEIMITVTPPKSPGQYLLEIFTEKTTVDPQVAIACYYLINFEAVEDTTLSDESYSIKVARKMLKHAMKQDNIPDILFRIQDLTTQKISELDKDVQTARARIVMLKRKQPIREMNIDQRLQSLNVVRQTEYELRLYDLTNKLEKLESRMREKDQFHETESQTANDMSDGIQRSLSLVRSLLGRSVDTKKKDNDIAEMLHQLKHQGLVLQPNDVKQVSSILDQLTFNQMQSYNSSIASAIYKSVQDIVCLMTG